jgi:glycosyltransferase involved in cell wall biosynthesis
MAKRRVAFNSNYPLLFSGLGKNTKYVLDYLYSTHKYDLTLYAMGLPYEHPDFARLPYKVVGSLPTTPQEIDAINKMDDASKRAWSYGNGMIDRFVREHKPDTLILSDDQWSFSDYWKKPWADKINTIYHITIDSLPILPQAIDCAKSVKNYYTWAKFAEEEFHRLGFPNVQTIPGAISQDNFVRFSDTERLNIRKMFDLPENEFIVGMDSRNQIRKEFGPLLEGFSLFLKNNPTSTNVSLFLITGWHEGWDIPRFIKEFDIPNNKILTVYLCKDCQNITVRPFEGQNKPCKFCGGKDTQQTMRIDYGCSEEQLNIAYNLYDAYIHLANASGLELGCIQALYSEIPMATLDYAGLSWYARQPFVEKIAHSWTRQLGTQFLRACPNAQSVADKIALLYNLTPAERRERGIAGRKWAIDTFSPQVVGKQWEAAIDKLPICEWDFNFEYQKKNDAYPYRGDESISDAEFIIDMYQKILFLANENNAEADGVKGWLAQLRNGATRRNIYDYYIKIAKEENAKNIPVDLLSLFDTKRPNKRLMVLIKESFGDCFYVTALLQSIQKNYPDYDIYAACDPKYAEVFNGNPYVYKVIPYIPQLDNELLAIGSGMPKGLVDVYINPSIATQFKLNYLSNDNPKLP